MPAANVCWTVRLKLYRESVLVYQLVLPCIRVSSSFRMLLASSTGILASKCSLRSL